MKKLSISLLVMLLIASLFTSCSMGSDDASDVRVKVKITPSGGGRSLNTDIETINLDDNSIAWHYSATKVSEKQFNYGETSDSLLPKDGIVTLSQGQWNIELRGFKDGKKVYAGTTSKVTIKWNFYEPNVTVQVPVNENTGDKGFIVLTDVKIKVGESEITPNYASIDGIEITNLNGSYMKIECAPGNHDVTFAYKDGSTVYAEETITVEVKSGLETKVIGFIDGSGSSGSSESQTTVMQPIEGGVKTTEPVIVEASVAPATTSTPGTKITFEAGSFTKDSTDAVLNLSVTSAGGEFSVTSTGPSAPVAGINISLLVNGNEVKEFNGKEVVIETYIAKNLTDVVVKYNGQNGGQPIASSSGTNVADRLVSDEGETLGYNPNTGLLRFKTNHFSEYYVLADCEAVNVTTNVGYATLSGALSSANNNEVIALVSNVAINEDILLGSGNYITLDLSGYNIECGNNSIKLASYSDYTGSTLNICGRGTIFGTKTNDAWPLILKGSAVSNETKCHLIIGKDVTVDSWFSVCIMPNNNASFGVIVDIYGTLLGNEPIYVHGNTEATTDKVPVINIHDGATVDCGNFGMYLAGYAKTTIDNASIISNKNAISIAAGELYINGATITGGSEFSFDAGGGGSITFDESSAVYVKQHSTNLPIKVKVNSGTFKGAIPFYQAKGANDTDNKPNTASEPEKVSIAINDGSFISTYTGTVEPERAVAVKSEDKAGFITGGTFSTDPSNYVAGEYAAKKVDENKWIVKERNYSFDDPYEELAFCVDCYKNPETDHASHNKYLNIANGVAEVERTGAWMAFKNLDWNNKSYILEYDVDLSDLQNGCFIAFDSGEMKTWQDIHLGFKKSDDGIIAYNTLFTNQLNDSKKLGTIGNNVHVSYTYDCSGNTLNMSMSITDGTNGYSVEKTVGTFNTSANLCWDVYTADGESEIYAKLDNFKFKSVIK